MSIATPRALLVGALLLGLSASAAAQVAGKLILGAYKPAPPPTAPRASYYWEIENGIKELREDRVDAPRELAVVLVGGGEPVAGLDRVEVAFSGGSLLPSTIVVRTGATLLFRNDDEFAHEVYAQGLAALAAEATSPRGRRSVSLTSAGAYALRDKVVPHVEGHLHVLPDLIAVAAPDAEGQFSFKQLAPGKYTLKVFHGARELVSQPLELTSSELTLDPITLTASPDTK
jgi:hypothetical protein